jgi:5-methylcytosine-specific restriction enzyme A
VEAPKDIPAVRILPMSDKIPGFRERTIEQVQRYWFLNRLPKNGGKFGYIRVGLNARPGTVVLFQFRARIIASATFLRDERYEKPIRGSAGVLHFDPASFRTFAPLDLAAIRAVWPRFRAFGHVRQFLNPQMYGKFKRRLSNVKSPAKQGRN